LISAKGKAFLSFSIAVAVICAISLLYPISRPQEKLNAVPFHYVAFFQPALCQPELNAAANIVDAAGERSRKTLQCVSFLRCPSSSP
jgi:hypothetical protein